MKRKLLIFLLTGMIFRAFAMDVDAIIDKTLQKYENMTSFYAEFNQVYCDELSGTCTRYEGKIYFQKPNFFRMEMDDPKQIYVGDSMSLWIYLPAQKRAVRQHLGKVPFQISPDIFLKDYDKTFHAELTKESQGHFEITLTPKEEIEIYEKITITIKNNTYEITGISIIDEVGSESKFSFDKIDINKKLSKDLFQFSPPKGTTVDEY